MTEFIVTIFALIGAFCFGGAIATRMCRKDIENIHKDLDNSITIKFRHED